MLRAFICYWRINSFKALQLHLLSETRFPGHGSPTEPLLFESPSWWLSKYMRFTILKMEYYPFNIRFYELKLHILRQPSTSVSPSHHPHVGDRGEIRCRGSNFWHVYICGTVCWLDETRVSLVTFVFFGVATAALAAGTVLLFDAIGWHWRVTQLMVVSVYGALAHKNEY